MSTTEQDLDGLASEFAGLRAHLTAVAYRLTGTVSDAEDAVQESWLRLAGLAPGKRAEIRDRKAWLTTVVSRICLDRLRSAAVQREQYVGQWLPEPIVTPLEGAPGENPLDVAVRDEGIRMAAMVVLDKLTPEQRVAFVLHDAFSVPFGEIASILGCSPEAARQHGSRGRRAVDDAGPPLRTTLEEQQALLEKFMVAMMTGDIQAVAEALHPDVVLIGDSNGKARTSRQIMVGGDKIMRFLQGLLRKYRPGSFESAVPVLVNGDLGLYMPPNPGDDGHIALDAHVNTFAISGGRIIAIYDCANPDKLSRVPSAGTGTRQASPDVKP
ncbi:sigma-70 family RNA polymerase sigma factor [Amycolatopsis sp. CA-230715]|uniref:sigma-70 family RNA polymerase sigma factor n=1 Tax=Amycolatopsis sp. CA-230715 TaxID=2745196 RepID=UPI001C0280FD|nr:sigma-70 family RNA polymerase sigma factor [Amycolatopsis sp. CA-230715]QWF77286.1 ECF RNA polymerase sigma factor SigJ [Amycolatopsis sp. CA-230715]